MPPRGRVQVASPFQWRDSAESMRVPALAVGVAEAGDLRLQVALLAEPQRDPLAEGGGVQVRDLLELCQPRDERRLPAT